MGPGRPLPKEDRAYFESRLGADLADVRVHIGDASHRTANSLHASAFTVGSHVGFRAGRFAPGTAEGQKLLAHELTHVLQQRRGANEKGLQSRLQVGQSADTYEQEADQVADQVMSTPAITLAHEISHVVPERPSAGTGVIQRQVEQPEAGPNILRHTGRWTDIDSPAVLGLGRRRLRSTGCGPDRTCETFKKRPKSFRNWSKPSCPGCKRPSTAQLSSPGHQKRAKTPTKPCACDGHGSTGRLPKNSSGGTRTSLHKRSHTPLKDARW